MASVFFARICLFLREQEVKTNKFGLKKDFRQNTQKKIYDMVTMIKRELKRLN